MTVLGIHASKRAPQSGSQEREKLLEHARLVLAILKVVQNRHDTQVKMTF